MPSISSKKGNFKISYQGNDGKMVDLTGEVDHIEVELVSGWWDTDGCQKNYEIRVRTKGVTSTPQNEIDCSGYAMSLYGNKFTPYLRDYDNMEVTRFGYHSGGYVGQHDFSKSTPVDGRKEEVEALTVAEKLRAEAREKIAQAKLIESRPEDDFEEGAILVFYKNFGRPEGTQYSYTAIKGRNDNWYISGEDSYWASWEGLLAFTEKDGGTVDGIYHVTSMAEVPYQ